MEDAGRDGPAATENGIEGEGYVVVKAATADGEGDPAAAAGGDHGDLAAPDEDAAPAKGGSGDAAGSTKARPQNGRVPAGTASAAPMGKKPGVLLQ